MVLSDTPTNTVGIQYKSIPFNVQLKIVPIRGKRFEVIRYVESIINSVEGVLDLFSENPIYTGSDIMIICSRPIAYIPQFGNKPARLSFAGFIKNAEVAEPPISMTTIDQGGIAVLGPSSNSGNRIPDPTLDPLVSQIYNYISLSGEIYKLDIAGVTYGAGGFHFPH
jgi:hypothetical protein